MVLNSTSGSGILQSRNSSICSGKFQSSPFNKLPRQAGAGRAGSTGLFGSRIVQPDLSKLGLKNASVQQPLLMNRCPFLCHPERTRISCFAALTATTDVVLSKENHTLLTEAATLDRKSGEAEGSAVPRTSHGNTKFNAQREFSSQAMNPASELSRRDHNSV
jgi:hypothetical protein